MEEYYICILDFEATCCDNNEFPKNQMEIIEFPSLLYKIVNNNPIFISEFHKYVKPTIHPILTQFCTNLTGITQDMINFKETINIVYEEHKNWIIENIPKEKSIIFATCGHWDLKTMLPTEIENKKLNPCGFYCKYINIKDEFEHFYKIKAFSMKGMMTHLKIPLEGRLHSGIDDTKNMTKILLKMINVGHTDFKINNIKNVIYKRL
jgi:ERI1 exoribonuclease 3